MQVSDDIHWQYKYELLIALYHDDIDKFRTELANGMDPNLTFYLPTSPDCYLNEAIKFGISDIAHLLIAAGADPNRTDVSFSPLIQASGYGELDVMEDLIEHGANVNEVSSSKYTPMSRAFQTGDVEVIKMLIEHGGSVEIAVQSNPQQMHAFFHHLQGTDVEWYLQSQGVSIRQ
jgi:ankyrin repeat protein